MNTKQWTSLFMIAILSSVIWRLEVEWHGWHGLIWLSYFHWAIPCGVVAFILWAVFWSPLTSWGHRLGFGLGLLVMAVLLYVVTSLSLSYAFIRGPSAFVALGTRGFVMLRTSVYLVWPCIPICSWGIARLVTRRGSVRQLGLSLGLFLVAVPVSSVILWLLNHKGGSDMIHTLKSGVIIPWLVMALGIPYCAVSHPNTGDQETP